MSPCQAPECCQICKHFDWSDSYNDCNDVAWCNRGLIFPTKKQACAIQNKPLAHAQSQTKQGGEDE